MYSHQFQRQLHTPAYEGQRKPDFSPFKPFFDELTAARSAELDAWLPEAPVLAIQFRLARGELSARELVLYFIQRIRRFAWLNAVGELNPDALVIADRLDAERRAGQVRGPLHGIPLLLKDNIATGDRMHTTAGAKALESARAPRDAFIALKLRTAGAVLLGKANLSEWANFMTQKSANGFSVLGGQVRNPYGKFDVSGSSSGPAAALAAGLAPLAVGTETCGSLIAPGSANSLAVLKPSLGLVSRDLLIPITGVTDTAGPMARSVTDLTILMHALTGPDPNDPITMESEPVCELDCTQFLDAGALRGMRVGWVANLHANPANRPLVDRAKTILTGCGAAVVELPLRHVVRWKDILEVFAYGMQHDLNHYLQAVAGFAPLVSLAEVIAFNNADLANRAPFGQDLLERSQANPLTVEQHERLVEKIRGAAGGELRRLRAAGGVDVLVSLGNSLSSYYAIAGLPALTVPAGYRAAGGPLGLTFVGDHFEDGKLIAAAYAFEQAAQARRPCRLGSG